jgi:hypothetical protein
VRSARLIHNHDAALHDPTYVFDDHLDTGKWIALNGDDIGKVAGGNGAEALLKPEHFCRRNSRACSACSFVIPSFTNHVSSRAFSPNPVIYGIRAH